MSKRACLYSAAAALFVAGCSRTHEGTLEEDRAQLADSGPSPARTAEDDESVRSVYPLDTSAPDPAVVRLCVALQARPQTRLAECRATTPGVLVTSECVRTLGAALHSGAATLDIAGVDRCVDATDRALAGCAWVGHGVPEPPSDCEGVVRGALATGSRCRSSLECLDGLRCHGVGPTTAGRCGPPHDDGAACGGSVDSLAVYARQNHYDARHPECQGWCSGRKCAPTSASR